MQVICEMHAKYAMYVTYAVHAMHAMYVIWVMHATYAMRITYASFPRLDFALFLRYGLLIRRDVIAAKCTQTFQQMTFWQP